MHGITGFGTGQITIGVLPFFRLAIVTGAADKGTWVRLEDPPIEGRLESGFGSMDVGQGLRVKEIIGQLNI